MELKVWVEGIQRIVCGVTETTTCQDVVFALAHATGKVGRFTLIERWRNNERLLAPQEYPLKILSKWGEYSNDIQFILRRSDSGNNQKPLQTTSNTRSPIGNGSHNTSNPNILESQNSPNRINTTPTYNNNNISNTSPGNPVGVVKGVQQTKTLESDSPVLKDVPPYREPPPPYRSPPPPSQALRKSPNRMRGNRSAHMSPVNLPDEGADRSPEAVSYNSQYRELVSLVNYQREKLSSQQVDLIKYDAEIGYWENKGREQDRQVELLQQQISSADNQLRISTEQVQALNYIEEESEIVKQNEKTLKSEIVLVRSKLANCETELLQCKNKIRKLMEEIHNEQRIVNSRQQENRQALERSMLAEMENLQSQIQQAKHATEINHLTAENLKREVGVLEDAIMEKKRQVERLVQEMKEANLQSLTGSVDELRHPLDGLCKAGSARRIIGSPRQLENAAPTNKNPHGVWV
ncbi:ras association domain-containing protein 8 isoform X1 [Galleria mellonella]|uniref:Ras association domain-containing protein 8 isoform X1 n=1 Tax=Galleria mellonella TaxID=7137 RepID=A0A6J1X5C6_GALME|nr:ras association domain-containing protein 8 isoform X1 [Galleria mellonella]